MKFKSALKKYASKKISIPDEGVIRCIALGLQGRDVNLTSDEALNLLLKKSSNTEDWSVLLKIQYMIHRCIPLVSRRMNKKLSEEQFSSIYGQSENAIIHKRLIDEYNLLIKASSVYYSLENSAIFEENLREAVKKYTIDKLIIEAKSLNIILSNLQNCAEQCIYAHDMKNLDFTAFLLRNILEDAKKTYRVANAICDELASQFFEIDFAIVNYVSGIFEEFLELTDSLKNIYSSATNVVRNDIEPPSFKNKVESLKKRMWNHEAEAEWQQTSELSHLITEKDSHSEEAKSYHLLDIPLFPAKKIVIETDIVNLPYRQDKKGSCRKQSSFRADDIQNPATKKKKNVRFNTEPSSETNPDPYPNLDTDSVLGDEY